MALTELIAAKTTAETSGAIILTGPTQIVADDLTGDEEVAIHRERKDETYEALIINGRVAILTAASPSMIIESYSGVKAVKGVTAEAASVSYAS